MRLSEQMPVVGVTGPRQSGKTTLCRAVFGGREYVSLEPLDVREFAISDPRGFLGKYRGGAIFDEVQRAPSLFSYLQEEVDRDPRPGRFILTGSQHFGLTEGITQSLAGRIGLLYLLPLSLDELLRFESPPRDLWSTIWTGGYPRILDRGLNAGEWLADYVATYVQRDVRQVLNVTDLDAFTSFLRLVAARTGQELNLSTLGGDAGVTHNTARAWLSVLEASFVVFRVPPWHRNLRKRVVKTAKLHFVDTGLACYLLGIRSPEQAQLHPLRGALFESWVASEIRKARFHTGHAADLFHMRESRGLELDIVAEAGERVYGVEAKSGATMTQDFIENPAGFSKRVATILPHVIAIPRLVYGGERHESRQGVEIIPWRNIQAVAW